MPTYEDGEELASVRGKINGAIVRADAIGSVPEGLIGNGSTSNAAAVQAAVDGLSEGGAIILPDGDFAIDTPIEVNTSDLTFRGLCPAEPRNASGNWPSRLVWTGAAGEPMFRVRDPGGTGLVRAPGFENLTLDGGSTTNVTLIEVGESVSKGLMRGVTLRNTHNGLVLNDSAFGWKLENVNFFNFANVGADLRSNNHQTTFVHCRAENVDVDASQSSVRIGVDGEHSSNVNFYGCDFEAAGVEYQIEAWAARNLAIFGGYQERGDALLTAFIRLGNASQGTSVDGFVCSTYFQAGAGVPQAILVDHLLTGAEIFGCDFRGTFTNSIIRNNGGAARSRFGANALNGNAIFSGTARAKGFDHGNFVSTSIGNNAAISLDPPPTEGLKLARFEAFTATQPPRGGAAILDAEGTAAVHQLYALANTTFTTGALAGTTGTSGHLTVSAHSDGKVYLENRSGATVTVVYRFDAP